MKNQIRLDMLDKRKITQKHILKIQNDMIVQSIRNDAHFQAAQCVAIYYPMGNEVNLLSLTNASKKFAFPKVYEDGIHFHILDQHMKFKKSKFGVMEPIEGTIADDQIEYMLVPALAISKDRFRIGFGKGYYDQFLSKIRPKYVIGVIYDFQEVDTFEVDAHDQQLDRYFKGEL